MDTTQIIYADSTTKDVVDMMSYNATFFTLI